MLFYLRARIAKQRFCFCLEGKTQPGGSQEGLIEPFTKGITKIPCSKKCQVVPYSFHGSGVCHSRYSRIWGAVVSETMPSRIP